MNSLIRQTVRSRITSTSRTHLSRTLTSSSISMAPQRVKVADASNAPKAGEHKEYKFAGEGDDEVKVLLANVGGNITALSPKCTHYGAPLAKGVMSPDGRIVCPWHGACFNAKGGDIEDAPGLDSLLKFELTQDTNGDIYVTADAEKLKGKPGVGPEAAEGAATSGTGVVIIGGGAAAINAVEAARKAGYKGALTILSAEPYAPLDRTKISKALMTDASALAWRTPTHLEKVLKVQLKTSTKVTGIDLENRQVKVEGGEDVAYEKLILATGGTPRRLPVEGAKAGQLKNVFTVRGVEDAKAVVGALEGVDVVVIGSSFIGIESACAIAGKEKSKSVSVVGMESAPLENVLGKEVGAGLQQALSNKPGLKFYMSAGVQRLEGDEAGNVKAVVIKNSAGQEETLPAGLVVLGVGVAPATEYLKSTAGFPELAKDGSVFVNKDFEVKGLEGKGVYAAGDIARTPARTAEGKDVRIEHWNVASNHGRFIGTALAGAAAKSPFNKLPIFWSALGAQLRYVSDGNPPGFDSVHVDGKPAEQSFVAYYAKGDTVTAVATMGRDPVMSQSAELILAGRMPSLSELKAGKDPLKVTFA